MSVNIRSVKPAAAETGAVQVGTHEEDAARGPAAAHQVLRSGKEKR